jgi:hypothetical protein
MLVPGPWRHAAEVQLALRARGISAELAQSRPIGPHEVRVDVVEDSQLATAFRWGRGGTVDEDLLNHIAACPRAALIECGSRLNESAGEVGRLGRALRDAGGLAVRMEASGAASAWEPWLEHLESGDLSRLYACAVLLVHDDDGVMFTCGMHHFDLPDAQIRTGEPSAATAWLDAFCIYQLVEQPTLLSGHRFRPTTDAPRRTLERWPDHRHKSNDGRHNPFGLWRFLEPDAHGIEATRTVLVMIPALVAVLLSAERSAGHPLTRSDVEAIVNKGSAVAVEPRDVAALERSRGYADIEPELAWEQWQIVRSMM